LCGAVTWTVRKVYLKYVESFEMWGCRRVVTIIWTNHMKNKKVLDRVMERRNILHTKQPRKVNCVAHILCRNCFQKCFMEGKIEGRI
jgi:hypothetical protein